MNLTVTLQLLVLSAVRNKGHLCALLRSSPTFVRKNRASMRGFAVASGLDYTWRVNCRGKYAHGRRFEWLCRFALSFCGGSQVSECPAP